MKKHDVHTHNGIWKETLGRAQSDKETTQQVHLLKTLSLKGKPQMYFIDKFNRVQIKRGSTWWCMKELARHFPEFSIDTEDSEDHTVLEKVWYQVDDNKHGTLKPVKNFYYKWSVEK